jgi:hypothetical protein
MSDQASRAIAQLVERARATHYRLSMRSEVTKREKLQRAQGTSDRRRKRSKVTLPRVSILVLPD